MKKTFYFLIIIIQIHTLISPLSAKDTSSYISNGTLKAFWKNRPLIGRWLSSGYGLIQIPDYLSHTSFPYQKRPYSKEVPFTEHFTIVRLLGGWDYRKRKGELLGQKEADLVYIKKGKMHYRWELLSNRLDPYIEMGYSDLTLVLDNIPWAFPKKPKLDRYGQTSSPYDMKKWKIFLKEMLEELIRLYGYEKVNNFRFRVGTEGQHKHRFNGTQVEYKELYMSSCDVIKKLFPHAKVSPFNHGSGKGQLHKNNIDMNDVVSSIENNKGSYGTIDFLPISTYQIIKRKNKKNMKKFFDTRHSINNRYFTHIQSLTAQKLDKEVHEFGILNHTIKGLRTNEPGAKGTAWRLYSILDFLENNVSKLFHWQTFDKVTEGKYLLQGNGWLYSVMEHLVGGYTYSLPVVSENNIHHKTLLIKKKNKTYLLTTVFPDKNNLKESKSIRIVVPRKLLPFVDVKRAKWTFLSSSSSAHDIIHDELIEKNLLNHAFTSNLHMVGRVKQMGGKKVIQYVQNNWNKYEKIIIDSLTLKSYDGEVENKNDFTIFTLTTETPSVNIIVIENLIK